MDVVSEIIGKFAEYGYETSLDKAELLAEYLRYLVEYNRSVNLTAITDERDIIVKHFLDSMAACEYLKEGARLADIGSGAGFPAVVLKIYRPDLSVTLIEANGKKVSFLTSLIERLGLKGIDVIKARAEEIGRKVEYRGKFDVVTARAVTEARVLLEYAVPLLVTGGELIAYKAHWEAEAKAADQAARKLNAELEGIEEKPIEGQYRTLVRYRKKGETPAQYPRRNAKIEKEPL